MDKNRNAIAEADEDLVDILLDFIIVSASLAKKVSQEMRTRQHTEGGHQHGQNQRNRNGDSRASLRSRSY